MVQARVSGLTGTHQPTPDVVTELVHADDLRGPRTSYRRDVPIQDVRSEADPRPDAELMPSAAQRLDGYAGQLDAMDFGRWRPVEQRVCDRHRPRAVEVGTAAPSSWRSHSSS